MHAHSLAFDPAIYNEFEDLANAHIVARNCISLVASAFEAIAGSCPWSLVRGTLKALLAEIEANEKGFEVLYEEFSLACAAPVKLGAVEEASAHATALALARWLVDEAWQAAADIEAWMDPPDLEVIGQNYAAVVLHFASSVPRPDLSCLGASLDKELIVLTRTRRIDGRLRIEERSQTIILDDVSYSIAHRNAFRVFQALHRASVKGEGPQSIDVLKQKMGLRHEERPDRYLNHLPTPVKATVHRQEGRGGGFFLCLDLPTSRPR